MSGAGNKGDAAGVASLLQKSKDNWDLSGELRHKQLYDAAANRLYYSLFQAVKAYAVNAGKLRVDDTVSVHETLKRLVREEGMDFKTFGNAMNMRKTADYEPRRVSEFEFDQDFLCKADALRQTFSGRVAKRR